jgi:hypothetical protein
MLKKPMQNIMIVLIKVRCPMKQNIETELALKNAGNKDHLILSQFIIVWVFCLIYRLDHHTLHYILNSMLPNDNQCTLFLVVMRISP